MAPARERGKARILEGRRPGLPAVLRRRGVTVRTLADVDRQPVLARFGDLALAAQHLRSDLPRSTVVVRINGHARARRAVILTRRENQTTRILALRDPDPRARTETRAEIARADHLLGDILGGAPVLSVVRRHDPECPRLRRIGIGFHPPAAEKEDLARPGIDDRRRVHEGIAAPIGRSGQVHGLRPGLAVVRTAADHNIRMALVHPRLVARLTEDQQRTVAGRHDRRNTIGIGSRTRRKGGRGFDLRETDRSFGGLRTQVGHQRGRHLGTLDLVVATGRKRAGKHQQKACHQRRPVHTLVFSFHRSG